MVGLFNKPGVTFNDTSDDAEGLGEDEELSIVESDDDSDEDNNSDDNLSGVDVPDVDEESGGPSEKVANPFYDGAQSNNQDDESSTDFDSDNESDDELEDDKPNPKPEDDEEDELIKAIKAAREKKRTKCSSRH